MKFVKRTMSVFLALLMLATTLPLSVYAATLKITTQPKTSYTAYGATAKASVVASGDGLTYVWYFKNAGSTKYSKSSVTKSTYSVTMTEKVNGRYVYCVVKDKRGNTVKSSAVVLRMKATITTQPKTAYAKQGEVAKTTVAAKGDGLTYVWYFKNAGSTKYSKSSVTKSTYSVTMTEKVNGRSVYCVVKDKRGNTVKSSAVVLRMKATITTEPKTAYAKQGEVAKTTVAAKGDGLTYVWYFKNAGSTKYSKSSVTKSTYSVTMTEKVNGRSVYCVVTDKYGKTAQSKTVVLRRAVTIVTQPKSTKVEKGAIAKATVGAKGDGLTYVWYFKNAGSTKYSKSSVTKSTYSVTMSEKVNGRCVYCVVTDKYGKTEKSKTITLSMKETPLTITKQPECTTASAYDEVGFGIAVTGGTAPYSYQLKFTNAELNGVWHKLDEVEVLTMGSMTTLLFRVSPLSFSRNDLFCIVVTDAAGKQVTSNVVWVEENVTVEELKITKQPQSTDASVGDQVGFGIVVTGGTEPYHYQLKYYHSGLQNWQNMDAEILGVGSMTELVFTVTEESLTKQYLYYIEVTDADGQQVSSEVVFVNPIYIAE